MIPEMVGGIVSNLVGTGVNALAQFGMANWEKDENAKRWKQEQEYNAPAAQMQRLKDAGLNPYLMYGTSYNPGNTNAPPVKARDVGGADFGKMTDYAQVRNMDASLDQIHATTIAAKQAAEKTAAETDLINLQKSNLAKDSIIDDVYRARGIKSTDPAELRVVDKAIQDFTAKDTVDAEGNTHGAGGAGALNMLGKFGTLLLKLGANASQRR